MAKLIIIFFILLGPTVFAKTYYVKSASAGILKEAKFGAEVLESVSQAQGVEFLEADKTWYKVQYQSVVGWIPKMALSAQKPLGDQASVIGQAQDLSEGARKRASVTTTAGAGRGLLEGRQEQLLDLRKFDYQALEKLENVWVSPQRGEEFMREN